jgi:hypothetical protein
LTLAAVIVAVLLFGPFVRDSVDTAFNPWAHSWRGGPTLTGTWVGAAASPPGRKTVLFLDLRRAEKGGRSFGYSTCRTCPRIKGAARVCGSARSYEVWGSPDTWGGGRFHLKLSPPGTEQDGPWLGYLTGEWAGDLLSLTTPPEQGGAPVRFEMRRGAEADFAALCGKSGAG